MNIQLTNTERAVVRAALLQYQTAKRLEAQGNRSNEMVPKYAKLLETIETVQTKLGYPDDRKEQYKNETTTN